LHATRGRDGRRIRQYAALSVPRDTGHIMDLLTLYHLRDHLADEKFRLELSALTEDDPAHQHRLEQWMHRIDILLADVRGEVVAQELPGARSTVTAQEFETRVHGVLKAYAALDAIHTQTEDQL